MDDGEDDVAVRKDVEGAVTDCTETSMNGSVDKVEDQQKNDVQLGKEEQTSQNNGAVKDSICQPRSPSGKIGYLTLCGGRLTIKTVNGDEEKEGDNTSAVNGCDNADVGAEVKGETPDRSEIPEKAIHEPEVSGAECVSTDLGGESCCATENGEDKSASSPAAEGNCTQQTESHCEAPFTECDVHQRSPSAGTQCPETDEAAQEPSTPLSNVSNNSCDSQQGSKVCDEQSECLELEESVEKKDVTEKETELVAEQHDSDSDVEIIGEDKPSLSESSDVKLNARKTDGTVDMIVDQNQGSDSKAAEKPQSIDSKKTEPVDVKSFKVSADVCENKSNCVSVGCSAISEDNPPSDVKRESSSKLTSSAPLTSLGSEKLSCSPSKSTARKSVPGDNIKVRMSKGTARKTGQPQAAAKVTHNHTSGDSSEGTIKIVNLHPNSNIRLKLSELEKVLKCPKMKDLTKSNATVGTESGIRKENVSSINNELVMTFDECGSGARDTSSDFQVSFDDSSQSKSKFQHKRRRKKGGNYDFPGGKKNPKKKKCMALSATSNETRDQGDDIELPRQFSKAPTVSPRKHYNVIDLFKNRSFHKRHTSHEALMRHRNSDNPVLTGRTVSQMLNERRAIEVAQSGTNTPKVISVQFQPEMQAMEKASKGKISLLHPNRSGSTEGDGKHMVQKLFVTKEGLVSSVDIEDASERENLHHSNVQKRKWQARGSVLQTTSSEAPANKKPRLNDGEGSHPSVQQQPMVMVVAQHSQNAPGLRSILPKPHMATAIAMSAPSSTANSSAPTSVVVSAGQKVLLAAPPLLVKPGTKVAFVPVSAKSSFSLLPATMVQGGKGGSVPATVMSSLPKMFNLQSPSATKNSDALRALLSTSNGPRLKAVSVTSGSIPTHTTKISVPPASVVTTASLAQSKVLTPSSSSSSLSSSSSCKTPKADVKTFTSMANGLLHVTPPKTPESEALGTDSKGSGGDRDVIPLCCCKVVGAFFTKQAPGLTYCQAMDTVDGKALGCCNKVSNLQLVRPGVKIPFIAVCEVHRKRLKQHQCCPGCGIFCTQGKFYQCRKDGNIVHHFHRQCQISKNDKLFCPHCGEESAQVEVTLALNEPKLVQTTEQIRANLRKSLSKARMMPSTSGKKKTTEDASGLSATLPNSKTISSGGLPLGPDREGLEKLMQLCINKTERPKKYRVLPKNMYIPASEGDMGKVFYMLMDGMDPNQTFEEEDNQTVLHAAIYSNNLALVYLLVQAGACLHTPDKTLKTPLMCCAEYGHLAILQFLVKAGARLDDRGEDHMTCLHYAAKAGHMGIIQYILDIDAIHVNVTDEGGWTPLMWATESRLGDIVKFLVSRGGDPNKKDNEENNGLHWAAFAGSVEITELFLNLGCELDSPNEHGDRPLHIAARQGHYELVVILLARGANVDVKNNKDETPVSCCTNPNSQVCMALKVNKQLRSFAARLAPPERLVHRDVSAGREKNPIACVNAVDDSSHPTDYLYVNHNVETQDLHINNVITSLQSCRCKDDCSSLFCVCSRSSVTCWFDKYGRLTDDFNMLDPPLIFECNRACRCWVNCNNRVVQNGITVRMQVFRTKGRGWGVRSLMDIPKGTFICEYIGELISDQEADRREDDSYLFDLDNKDGDTYCVDARKYGNVSRFINHLCEPNLVPVKVFVDHQDLRFPRICFFSSRDIKAYEEFGFDYGEKFWIIKWKQFTCACRSPKCKYSTETIHRTLEEYRLRHEAEEQGQDGS